MPALRRVQPAAGRGQRDGAPGRCVFLGRQPARRAGLGRVGLQAGGWIFIPQWSPSKGDEQLIYNGLRMAREKSMEHSIPRLRIPPAEPVSAEEIERRRRVVADILALRKKIGPIHMSTADLFDNGEEETEQDG